MAEDFDKAVEGFKVAVIGGVMLFVLGEVIRTQIDSIDSKIIVCLLLSIVPLLSLVSLIRDFDDLKKGKIALFIGSLVGTIFCWIYL